MVHQPPVGAEVRILLMVTLLKEGDQIEQIALSSAGKNLLQVAEDAAWRTAKGLMEKPGRLVPARR